MKQEENPGKSRRRKAPGSSAVVAAIIFLSALSLTLAVVAGLFIRRALQQEEVVQAVSTEQQALQQQKQEQLENLNRLEKALLSLQAIQGSLEGQTRAQQQEIERLRKRIHTEGSLEALEMYDRQILELTLELNRYKEQLDVAAAVSRSVTGEKLQWQESLEKERAAREALQRELDHLNARMAEAAQVRIDAVEVNGVRETRRGDRPTMRARRTDRLEVCFTIGENALATPGDRLFFFQVMGPDGAFLIPDESHVFEFENERREASFSESMYFSGEEREVCAGFHHARNFQAGHYLLRIYEGGRELYSGLFELN